MRNVYMVSAYRDSVLVGTQIMSWDELLKLEPESIGVERVLVDMFALNDDLELAQAISHLIDLQARIKFEPLPAEARLERRSDKMRREVATHVARPHGLPVGRIGPLATPAAPKYMVPEGNYVCPQCGSDYPPDQVKDEWKETGVCDACM